MSWNKLRKLYIKSYAQTGVSVSERRDKGEN